MPTQGFNIKSISRGNFKFNAWDLGGQKAIREHWKNYYDKIDCIVTIGRLKIFLLDICHRFF